MQGLVTLLAVIKEIKVLEQIIKDANARTCRTDSLIVSESDVIWGDSALGVAQEAFCYTQSLVPGYVITVEAGEIVLTYHTDKHGTFKLADIRRYATSSNVSPPEGVDFCPALVPTGS